MYRIHWVYRAPRHRLYYVCYFCVLLVLLLLLLWLLLLCLLLLLAVVVVVVFALVVLLLDPVWILISSQPSKILISIMVSCSTSTYRWPIADASLLLSVIEPQRTPQPQTPTRRTAPEEARRGIAIDSKLPGNVHDGPQGGSRSVLCKSS